MPWPRLRCRARVEATPAAAIRLAPPHELEPLERRLLMAVGTLDPTFGGGGGLVTFDPPGPPLRTTDVIALADGGALASAFTVGSPGDTDVTLFRTDQNGNLDTDFGGNGTGLVVLDVGGDDRANSVHQLPSGKFLVAGTTSFFDLGGAEVDANLFIARFNADGTIDNTFGDSGSGFNIFDFGDINDFADGSIDRANDQVVLPDGRIVVFGQSNVSDPGGDFALVRFTEDGILDSNWATQGRVLTDVGGIDVVNAVTIGADGKLAAAGSTSSGPAAGSFAVVRYNVDGSADITFGNAGILLIDFLPGLDEAQGIVLQDDGTMIAGGIATSGDPNAAGFDADFAVTRFTAAGVLDSAFGSGGKAMVDFAGQLASINKLIIQPGGRLVAAGEVVSSLSAVGVESVQTAIARLKSDGTLDTGFSDDGRIVLPVGDITGPAPAPTVGDVGPFVFQGSSGFGDVVALADLTDLEARFEQFRQDSQGLVALAKGGAILILATQGDNVQLARLIGDGGAPSVFVALVPDVSEIDVNGSEFVIRYVDDLQVDVSSVGAGDVRVTGPSGFDQFAQFIGLVGDSVNAAEVTARYVVIPIGATFTNSDEGTYQIVVEPGAIADVNGNALQGGAIPDATFTVGIPENLANLRVDGPLTGKFPAAVVGGGKSTGGTVRVTNAGVLDARTIIAVTVFASTDAELDETADASIAVIDNVKISLKPGKSKALRLKFTQFPANLPDDDYFLIARIDSGNALAELKESDNNAPTLAPITIAAPFVDLSATPVSLKGVPISGAKISATILTRNGGNIQVKQSLPVDILASPGDATAGNADVLVTTPLAKLSLKPGLSRNTRLSFALPVGIVLAPGTYSLLAILDPQNLLVESDEANNVVVLGQFVI